MDRLLPALGLVCLALWIVLGFLVPVGAGWPHLFLGAAALLLIRRVVGGRAAR